ncbi:MAG: polyphenol oxidase family protein [Bacillaceae bacterium]|nr:polyphenol oxidase family protein [Bacillaceae bacterium]
MIGIAHAGWKGTVSKIGARMIEHWVKEEQSDLSDIYVAIGPAISKQYYEVDDFIIDKINHLEITSSNLYKRIREGKYLLDLKLVNLHLLLKAGIKEHNIFISDYCTYKEKELFYSYRRNNRTGRMISYICLHSDDS